MPQIRRYLLVKMTYLPISCHNVNIYLFQKIPANAALILPEEKPIYVPLLISGLTAAIAMELVSSSCILFDLS